MAELGRALLEAIGTSSDVAEAVRKIRHEGFSLYLVLNNELQNVHDADDRAATVPPQDATPELPIAPQPRRPAFRLNSDDVAFLKTVGIDATRPARRRRGSS